MMKYIGSKAVNCSMKRKRWFCNGLVATFFLLLICKVFLSNRPLSHEETSAFKVYQKMIQRRDLVRLGCDKGHGRTKQMITRSNYMNETHGFAMCRVAKVGSTFWLRFLYQMAHTNPIQSPFDIGAMLAYDHKPDLRMKPADLPIFQKMFVRVLFVREPFSRLLSAYVDKLLPPNPVFWKSWGVPAVSRYRPDCLNNSSQVICGHDTTFSEFVSFVTSQKYPPDNHLTPIYSLCSPCTNNYTVIGKMKSFEEDATYAVSLLGIPKEQIRFEKMEKEQSKDTIKDATGGSFSHEWLKSTLQCITREAAAQRVWRKLQVRGVISWRQPLRLTEKQKESIEMEELRDLLFKAQALSTNATELKVQKKQAFAEAFSSLDLTQLDMIIRMYGPDFVLFGYPPQAVDDLVAHSTKIRNTKAFDWTVDWDLTGL